MLNQDYCSDLLDLAGREINVLSRLFFKPEAVSSVCDHHLWDGGQQSFFNLDELRCVPELLLFNAPLPVSTGGGAHHLQASRSRFVSWSPPFPPEALQTD